MTDSAALLTEVNSVLREALPGTTQVVRRRIAADIHRKLKLTILERDEEIASLVRTVAQQKAELDQSAKRNMKAFRAAAAHALSTMEKFYGEESQQS